MPQRTISELAFRCLDRAGQLPPLGNTDDPVPPSDACFVQGIDDCTNSVRIKRYTPQKPILINILGQLGNIHDVIAELSTATATSGGVRTPAASPSIHA